MTTSSNTDSAMPVLDMSDEARALRIGLHVLDMARKHGWKDDGEGAFEYIQRQSYVVGYEDAGGKVKYSTETKGSRWPITALVDSEVPDVLRKLHASLERSNALSKTSMEFAAQLVNMDNNVYKGVEYIKRDTVMEAVMAWRKTFDGIPRYEPAFTGKKP